MIIWPAKGPDETEDFAFDFADVLAQGEGLASKTVAVDGVTLDSDAIAGSQVAVWLSGGTAGTVAKVTCTVTTDSVPARTYSEVAVLEIGGEAVSVAAAKAWLRVDSTDEDATIAALLRTAVRHVETVTGKKLTQKIVSQVVDGFPGRAFCGGPHPHQPWTAGSSQAIRLLYGPASEILSIAYDDPDGVAQVLTSFRLVEGENAKLLPAYGTSWPETARGPGTVRLSYIAGYDPTELPPELGQAAMLLTAHWYANREAVIADTRAAAVEVPMGVEMLLANYSAPGIA